MPSTTGDKAQRDPAPKPVPAEPGRDTLEARLLEWFERFAQCVRDRDSTGAEQLFMPDVIAFGTRVEMVCGIDSLRETQWRPTWNVTRDFRFLAGTIHLDIFPAGTHAWGTSLWTSCAEAGDQPGFDRRGRATFAFVWDGRWRCTHSHLSLTPTGRL